MYQQQECLGSGIFKLLQLVGNAQFTYNLDNTMSYIDFYHRFLRVVLKHNFIFLNS